MKEELLNELLKIFPDRILKDFSKRIPNDLRKKIEQELNTKKLKNFLIDEYNFVTENKKEFDCKIIKTLENDYSKTGNYRRKIFQEIEKTSKQRIEQKIKVALNKAISISWEVEELDSCEIEYFMKLINSKKFKFENEERFIFIFQNTKDCIILIYNKLTHRYKVISNQENKYIKQLLENNFHKYEENDFSNISYLKKIHKNYKVQVTEKELIITRKKENMTIEKYINFLGFEYVHPNKGYTDSDILNILKRNIYPDSEKDVYLPTNSKDAQLLRTLAIRYGEKGIRELAAKFSFNYYVRDTHLRIKKTLNFLKNENNEIFLPAKGTFYHALCNFVNKKGLTLNEYISKINFIRIYNLVNIDEEEYINKVDEYYNSSVFENNIKHLELDIESIKFIKNIEKDLENIPLSNEKEGIIKQRLTQGLFKEKLIKRQCKCELCSIKNEKFLIASHIKPWSESNDYEKIDVNNGFLFCPNHDKLFDKGYISFQDDGKLMISDALDTEELNLFNLKNEMKIEVSEETKKYLEYHREECFRKIKTES